MSARDRYECDIKCESCGEEGVIGVSEDDYPFMRDLRRTIDSVKGHFFAAIDADYHITATCQKCGLAIKVL